MDLEIDHRVLDKDAISRYEQYTLAKPTSNGGIVLESRQDIPDSVTAELAGKKRSPTSRQRVVCCFCFKTTRYRRKQFIIGSLTNLGIFILLIAYTFLGAFIFLSIEGNNGIIPENSGRPRMLPDRQSLDSRVSNTNRTQSKDTSNIEENHTFSGNYFWEARSKTVENIWEITVSLNILYRENWTRLAAQEISKFQDELLARVTAEMASAYGVGYREMALGGGSSNDIEYFDEREWNLALAFFYSLSVLTTIGYGNIAPRTTIGKAATMCYALFGIPLTLLYLSSIGSLLSKLARSVFTRALCCCLCSNCGYCCYDERRMAEKERRMKLKRQQEETTQTSQSTSKASTEDCYVLKSDLQNKDMSSDRINSIGSTREDAISWQDTDSRLSMRGWSILAPVLLCLCAIFIYIVIGAFVLFQMDNMRIIDGFYFCFMSLSTIGFGNVIPGTTLNNINGVRYYSTNSTVVWFCSAYTLTGLALTAMCFGVIHDEIIHRIKYQQKQWTQKGNTVNDEVRNLNDPFYMSS